MDMANTKEHTCEVCGNQASMFGFGEVNGTLRWAWFCPECHKAFAKTPDTYACDCDERYEAHEGLVKVVPCEGISVLPEDVGSPD